MNELYPDSLEITPLSGPCDVIASVPGSKSITNRALVLAALSARDHDCVLLGALHSEDTEVMVNCLNRLGFHVEPGWPTVEVKRTPGPRVIPAKSADLFVGNSGTTVRFLTAVVSLGEGAYRLDGVPRMRERPIQDLLDALRQLGVEAVSEMNNGCPPVRITSSGRWNESMVQVRGNVSSQFLSGLMLAAPFADGPTTLRVDRGLVSQPYVGMTQRMLTEWGLLNKSHFVGDFTFGGRQTSDLGSYTIEPDASAASYFFAVPAIVGGLVKVTGLGKDSMQGDIRFVEVLRQMGCHVEYGEDGITVGRGTLHGIDVDMNDISDTVMTLGAVACFAEGPTSIRNVAHIRHKETDRLAALATEIRRIGASVEEFDDGLTIRPAPLHGAEIETYNDHRIAMSLALVGLRIPGIVIRNPACVAKTYPGFFADLEKLR